MSVSYNLKFVFPNDRKGFMFIFELTHVYEAIKTTKLLHGLYTGIILIVIGAMYWKEVIKQVEV